MKRIFANSFACTGLALVTIAGCGTENSGDKIPLYPGETNVFGVLTGDREMAEAIETARMTMPEFVKTLKSPGKGRA